MFLFNTFTVVWSLVTMGAAHRVALQLPDLAQPTNCSQCGFVTLLGEGWNFAAIQYDPIACLLWILLPTNGRHRGRSLQSLEHSHTSLCSPIYHISVAVTPLNRVGSLSLLYENAKSKFVFRYYEAVAVVIKYFFIMSLSDNVHVLIVCMPWILLTHIPPCVSQRESKSPLDFHSRVCTRFEAIIWYFAVWKIFLIP